MTATLRRRLDRLGGLRDWRSYEGTPIGLWPDWALSAYRASLPADERAQLDAMSDQELIELLGPDDPVGRAFARALAGAGT